MLQKFIDRYHASLAWQIILPQLLMTLCLGVLGVFMVHYHTHSQMLEQLKLRGAFMVTSIEHAAVNSASLDAFGVYVEALGSAPGVELILIAGAVPPASPDSAISPIPPKILAATERPLIGRSMEELPAKEIRDDLERTLATGQGHFDDRHSTGDVFDYTAPIDLRPLFAGKAVLMSHLDIRADRRAAQSTARLLSIVMSVLVLCVTMLQIGIVRRRVLHPQAALLSAMRANEAGQHVRVPVQGTDELAQLAITHNQMVASLLASEQAKTEFLANLSHEIRTPLGGLLGITDLMALEEDQPERQALITQLRGAGINLHGLLERILDLAQLEMGRVQLNPQAVPLADIVNGAVMRYRKAAQEKGLSLLGEVDAELPALICIDGKRVVQMLNLLLDNAVKFSQKGSIRVSVRRLASADLAEQLANLPATDNVLEIDVADQGIGIAQDQIERVFGSFIQVDGSATRKAGGNGLGLVIVKRLVTLMKGHVSIVSRIEGGTIFRVHLPLVLVSDDPV